MGIAASLFLGPGPNILSFFSLCLEALFEILSATDPVFSEEKSLTRLSDDG